MEEFNTVLALASLVLGLSGVALTFVTFFAPDIVLRFAMNNSRRWREVPAVKENTKLYRHKTLSGYTIEVDLTEPVNGDFDELWMKALHRPDKRSASYYVTIHFNGLPTHRELFLQYDGGRNFMPVPMVRVKDKKRYLSFSKEQVQIANIVGYDYFQRSFDEVSESILQSSHNPEILEFGECSSETLGEKIASFRARSTLLKK